jgi:hypothetical protein
VTSPSRSSTATTARWPSPPSHLITTTPKSRLRRSSAPIADVIHPAHEIPPRGEILAHAKPTEVAREVSVWLKPTGYWITSAMGVRRPRRALRTQHHEPHDPTLRIRASPPVHH